MSQWPKESEAKSFYGNPSHVSGGENLKWVAENITQVWCPWQLYASWDADLPIMSIKIHRLCENSLKRVLWSIWDIAGHERDIIRAWGMHLYGGGYVYRKKRGGSSLSMHSYGCAVDFDPGHNQMGTRGNFADIPEVLAAFDAECWTHGGSWKRPDPMHWQATS